MSGLLDYAQTSGIDWSTPVAGALYHAFQEGAPPPALRQLAGLADLELQMERFEAEHQTLISALRRRFVFPADSSVTDFFSRHRTVPAILLQAEPYLRKHFGNEAVFNLRAPIDDSGSQTLYSVVMWPGPVRAVRQALERFDDEWWIPNSRQALGYLTFTYELV
jgi:hypothetical protein